MMNNHSLFKTSTSGNLMITRVLVILVLLGQQFITTPSYAQKCEKWKLVRNQNNIKIFVRKHKNSGLKEVLGITEIKSNLSTIISFIKDTKNHPNWMYANKQTCALKTKHTLERILQSASTAP